MSTYRHLPADERPLSFYHWSPFDCAIVLARGGRTPREIDAMAHFGQISDRQRRAYYLLWTWSATRFGGEADRVQERFYNRRGMAALQRRFARANAIVNA